MWLPRGMGVLGAAGRGPLGEATPVLLLAGLELRSALCSRALSQHRAPLISGLRLPGLRFWPQAAQRLAWFGRQKRTVKTKSFIPSSGWRALADVQVLRSLQLARRVGPGKGWMRACGVLALVFADSPAAARWARLAR